MNLVKVILVYLGSAAAVISMVGSFGLLNVFLILGELSWKVHLKVWLTCVVTLIACMCLLPAKIHFHSGDFPTYSDERVISNFFK